MSEKLYLIVLKSGIGLAFISVFLVAKSLLFPFISGKQIYFNILIELLIVVWLAFIIKFPDWRPKKSWISLGLAAFAAGLLVSSFFGVDFNLSFWGDVERMLGVFQLFHFLAFYFIIITVMRRPEDWLALLAVSVAAAVIVCLYAYVKHLPFSTIGNTAYVSGYVIFNIYFALILGYYFFKRAQKIKDYYWLAGLSLAAAAQLLPIFRLTHTRGAYVGLGVSAVVVLFLFLILNKNKKVKLYSFIILLVLATAFSLVLAFPNSSIVRKSSILGTISQITTKAATFQTRLISWKAAAQDFPSHPLLGTGYGNFAVTFDKHFDPSFYDYTTSETYFDRAHNNMVDIASTAGSVGLLTYLSIFAAAFYYLIRGLKQGKIDLTIFVLVIALLTAYFIQNLVVFDSLVTYISLMVLLAYIYWLDQPAEEGWLNKVRERMSGLKNKLSPDRQSKNKEIIALSCSGLIMLIILFQFNYQPLRMLKGTIRGQYGFAAGQLETAVREYQQALSYRTVLDRDSRASFVRSLASSQSLLRGLEAERAREILDYGVSLAEANVKYNSGDSMMQMQLAQILNLAAGFNTGNPDKFFYYSNRAEAAINKSLEAGPGRIPVYFIKAQIFLARGDKDQALATLNYAVSLNPEFADGQCQLARTYFYLEDEQPGFAAMDKCLDSGGAGSLAPADLVVKLINHYSQASDNDKLFKLYHRLAELQPNDANLWVVLAKLYAQRGDTEMAKNAAAKAVELNSSFRPAADEFIRSLE